MTNAHDLEASVKLTVQLCQSLSQLADHQGKVSSRVRTAVQKSVAAMMARFGIPGTPDVTITADGADVEEGGKVLRLHVSGRTVRYSNETLRQAWSYVNGRALDPDATPEFIQARLTEFAASSNDDGTVVHLLSLLCEKIVQSEPASLFGPSQCHRYASTLDAGVPADPDWLLEALRTVLNLGVSIADQRRVATVIETSGANQASTIEGLVAALQRESIDILLDKTTLRELTINWPEEASTVFPFLRESLFQELGISVPRFRFVIVDDHGPNSFSFRINDFVSVPLACLPPGQLMVNDTVERLRESGFTDASPISNPATGQANGLIHASANHQAQEMGLTTWTQSGHLILAMAEFLRSYGWCTLSRDVVRTWLEELKAGFPAVVAAATAQHADEEITGVLRSLARERISIQNLRAILEGMLDFDLSGAVPAHGIGATSMPPDAVALARITLGPAIAQQAARGTDTVVVYLIDPEIERIMIGSASPLDERLADAVLDAIRRELAYLPAAAQVPHLLTSVESRATLQRLVALEHPRIAVLAHEELPPGRNVMPIARIAL